MSKTINILNGLVQKSCRGKPVRYQSQDGQTVIGMRLLDGKFRYGFIADHDKVLKLVEVLGIPSGSLVEEEEQEDGRTRAVFEWESLADTIFGPEGTMAQVLDGYESREGQIAMARACQRSVEMKQNAIIEAPTGTGKSFAYAAILAAMGKRFIITTSQ